MRHTHIIKTNNNSYNMTLSYSMRDNNYNTNKQKVIINNKHFSEARVRQLNSKKPIEPNLNLRETNSSSPFTLTTNHHHYNQIITKMNSSLLIAFVCLQLSLVYFDQGA